MNSYFYSKEFEKVDKFLLYLRYSQSWINGISPRKPFPGFHPGIYKKYAMQLNNDGDPLLHFLKSGSPDGRWKKNVILPIDKANTNILKYDNLNIAIHIHVYYFFDE